MVFRAAVQVVLCRVVRLAGSSFCACLSEGQTDGELFACHAGWLDSAIELIGKDDTAKCKSLSFGFGR